MATATGVLSDRQILLAVMSGGFPPPSWVTAVAVALAESGGNPNATNKNSNGSTDYGLFQINSIHAELLNKYKRWNDPNVNARMAFVVSSGGSNWRPWVAYTSGSYKAFLPRANKAIFAFKSDPEAKKLVPPDWKDYLDKFTPDIDIPDIPNPLDPVADFWNAITNPATWARFGFVLIGGILIIVALFKMSKADNTAARTVTKAAGIVAAGKVPG